MTGKKIEYFICVLLTGVTALFIFINSYSGFQMSASLLCFLNGINVFFDFLKIDYSFSATDLFSIIRFTEYFIFGILVSVVIKFHSRNITKNIFNVLFVGLLVAVIETYYRYLKNFNADVNVIVVSFVAFFIGYIVLVVLSRKKSSVKRQYRFRRLKF